MGKSLLDEPIRSESEQFLLANIERLMTSSHRRYGIRELEQILAACTEAGRRRRFCEQSGDREAAECYRVQEQSLQRDAERLARELEQAGEYVANQQGGEHGKADCGS